VIALSNGYVPATGCWSTAWVVNLGLGSLKSVVRGGRWGESGPNDLGVGGI
jgi:hypothetical protein